MTHPQPFDRDMDAFLVGDTPRELDVDRIFAKPFHRMMAEFKRFAPEDIAWAADDATYPSLLVPGLIYREVPCGIMLFDASGKAIGGYLSCDLGLDEAWQGQGLGTEIVIEQCLRSGEVPTWHLDHASYSPAGLAAHEAAWLRVRDNPEETARRLERMRVAA